MFPSPAPPPHRNAHARPSRPWTCSLHERPDSTGRIAWVQRVAPQGLLLFVEQPYLAGQTFEVLLVNPQATYLLRQSVTIERCERVAGGGWILTANFARVLRPEEFRPFLT